MLGKTPMGGNFTDKNGHFASLTYFIKWFSYNQN